MQLDQSCFDNVLSFLKPNRVVAVMQASKETNDRSWNIWRAAGPMTTVLRNVICSACDRHIAETDVDVMRNPEAITLGYIFKSYESGDYACESKYIVNLRRKIEREPNGIVGIFQNTLDRTTVCVAGVVGGYIGAAYALKTALVKQMLPHSSTKEILEFLKGIVDGDNFDEDLCFESPCYLVAELQCVVFASNILCALHDKEEASKSQNVQNETADSIGSTEEQPPGKEQADADYQEALNQSEAETFELDQIHVQTALRESEAHAIQQEQQDVTEALLRSKSDLPAVKYEILRLSACSGEITHTLLHSDKLAWCRNRVANAGAQFALLPEWANGALLLVPVTSQEIADAGIDLHAHHIVAEKGDVESINAALATIPRRHKRPKLKDHRPSSSVAASDGSNRDLADATQSALDEGLGFVNIIVENTFVKAYSVHGDCESSSSVPTHRTV